MRYKTRPTPALADGATRRSKWHGALFQAHERKGTSTIRPAAKPFRQQAYQICTILKLVENEIIPYLDMCHREGVSLQQVMNFQLGDGYSVILMSVRLNAPYRDEVSEDGTSKV